MMVVAAALSAPSHNHDDGYQIVSVTEWLDGWRTNGVLPLVDLRSSEEFNTNHLQNNDSTTPLIVNLPLESLISGERTCELPPRHVEFAILVPSNYTDIFSSLDSLCSIHSLFFASKSSATQQSRKPWLVRQVILENKYSWKDERVLKYMKHNTVARSISPHRPLPRLWRPDQLVSSGILPLLKDWMRNRCSKSFTSTDHSILTCCTHRQTVIDLGSGAGRDISYLAEEMLDFYHSSILQQNNMEQNKPFQRHFPFYFVGIDNHKGSAKRSIPLWKNRGVESVTSSHLLDLNKLNLVNDYFQKMNFIDDKSEKINSTVVCLYAVRFLNRKLLSHIANASSRMEEAHSSLCLPVGTIVAISHFCKPTETAEWNFDHPKVSNVLERGELRSLFGSNDSGVRWSILKDDICFDGDHGRTLIQFIAIKVS